MGESHNPAPRGRKRKGSSKSSTKSNKRKASTNEVFIKQESIVVSPVSSPKNLPAAEIPRYTSPNNVPRKLTLKTPINNKLPIPPKNLIDIPNEIFVQICAHLPPSDLLSLTLVCQRLKGLLCSPNSQETQAIWRTSRTRFLRFLQPPPPGMDEKSYIVLKQMEKGCQFCHENPAKVYLEFRVRCCERCLDKNAMSRDKLHINERVPHEVFRALPHVFRDASYFYWTRDVSQACEEYYGLKDEEIRGWIERREEIANMIMHEAAKHEHNEHVARLEAQSPNSNDILQPQTPQPRIFMRQPQLTTAPMSFASMASIANMANMVSAPMGTMGLTNPQPQFHQPQLIISQMQQFNNRSQFVFSPPPAQQFYSHPQFVPRITRQMIPQQMIPSHMIAGAPQMLTPQMVSPHCFGVPQFRRF